jgi:signal transduction histidine kinase
MIASFAEIVGHCTNGAACRGQWSMRLRTPVRNIAKRCLDVLEPVVSISPNRILWLRWLLRLLVFVVDCFTPANLIVPFLYIVIPFLFRGKGIDRRNLWIMALTSVALTLFAPVIGNPTLGAPQWIMWSNRLIVSVCILVVTYFCDQQQQAENRSRAKEVFLATLAHELRNPLAPLANGVAILQTSNVNAPRNLIEMMDRQVKHLVRLVDDLLDLSRIKGGKIRLRPKLTDLHEVMQTAVEACNHLIERAGQRLTVSVEPDTPTIEVDPDRIAQAFTNLLDNASKFTPAGGRIDVSIKPQGDWVVASVRDNGRGISPDALPHIFELFTQGEGETPGKGLGIGLALVKEIVELHHGAVTAYSEGLGKGSEITISLPLR